MDQTKNICILVVEIVGRQRLTEALGSTEAGHAIERCLNRVERAISANSGQIRRKGEDRLTVHFARCDAGAQAASEMLDRVLSLPPLRGLRMAIRVGLHYGAADSARESPSDAERVAARLAAAARRGQALASGASVMLLSPPTRHVVGAEAVRVAELDGLEWPVFSLGGHTGVASSLTSVMHALHRLRVRHQQEVVFVEAQRPVLLLGRELGNDVVIMDPRASRQHLRIEHRQEGFVLVDQSTNGTYVVEDGGAECCVKHGELLLSGPGRIGCGFSTTETERDLVFFEIV